METLPVFLRVKGKRAAVVGGGSAAARRVETLGRAGARVTVFAARLDDEFHTLRDATLEHVARDPSPADLEGFVVCYVATGDDGADERIFAAISGAGPLINVADRPDLCDFIAPSLVHRDPLVVAISTGGASPMLGRMLKARLESTIPAAYGRLAAFMGRSRALVGARLDDARARRRFWERMLEGPIAEMVLASNEAGGRGGALGRGSNARRRAADAHAAARSISSAPARATPTC